MRRGANSASAALPAPRGRNPAPVEEARHPVQDIGESGQESVRLVVILHIWLVEDIEMDVQPRCLVSKFVVSTYGFAETS